MDRIGEGIDGMAASLKFMLITRTICCRLELIIGLTVCKHSALFRLGWHVGNVFYLEKSCLTQFHSPVVL